MKPSQETCDAHRFYQPGCVWCRKKNPAPEPCKKRQARKTRDFKMGDKMLRAQNQFLDMN